MYISLKRMDKVKCNLFKGAKKWFISDVPSSELRPPNPKLPEQWRPPRRRGRRKKPLPLNWASIAIIIQRALTILTFSSSSARHYYPFSPFRKPKLLSCFCSFITHFSKLSQQFIRRFLVHMLNFSITIFRIHWGEEADWLLRGRGSNEML